nr:reverse transcriptase domain-containing protein [Tanacetum cinerariifolium]
MVECLAFADLGASINLMPWSVWKRLSLPDLTPTCMTLELADRSISCPVGVVEDVYVKVGELTLRVGKEDITFNLDQTSRYSANYNDITAKRIDVIDMAYEEYLQEVMGFSDVITSGNPTPYYDPIVSTTSPTLTPFENNDFLLEEVEAFLAIEYDPTLPEVDQSYLNPEGDILLLEAFLNDDPSLPPPNQGNYLPKVRKELKICKAKSNKSSIDEPPEVELKDQPPHLEYAFLEGDDKFPVIIVKDLSVEEKTALIMVLKSHKRAIAWKLSDIKGIEPKFCTHKILMEEDFKPVTAEDHIKVQLNELNELHDQAYENSLIYKEKTKRLHDSKIKDRVFNINDRVLLFNSRLKIFSGKLKSCGSGLFTISHAYPYGTVELFQPDGPKFKVNGHRLKHYFGEDVPKDDAFPSTNNEDKVFNPGILIQENISEVITRVAPDKNVKKIAISHASLILEGFDPPRYELPFFKEVLDAETLLSYS